MPIVFTASSAQYTRVRLSHNFSDAPESRARVTRARFVRLIYAFVAYTRRPDEKKNRPANTRRRRQLYPEQTHMSNPPWTGSENDGKLFRLFHLFDGVQKKNNNNTHICTRVHVSIRVHIMLYDRTCIAGGGSFPRIAYDLPLPNDSSTLLGTVSYLQDVVFAGRRRTRRFPISSEVYEGA